MNAVAELPRLHIRPPVQYMLRLTSSKHNADWVVRLGDGNAESARRMAAALQRAWPFVAESFAHDAVDDAAVAQGRGPARRDLDGVPMAAPAAVAAAAAGVAASAAASKTTSAETAATAATAASSASAQRAWQVLASVPDPEVPVLSVCDLGIVRDVQCAGDGTLVVLTPTYSGCPATEVIAQSVVDALQAAGLGPVVVTHRLAPAWTTDWISAEGREKLRAYGIAPPLGNAAVAPGGAAVAIRIRPHNLACPRCGSEQTERVS